MNRILLLLWLPLFQALVSCTDLFSESVQVVDKQGVIDSIVVPALLPNFPDTMYASAEKLNYLVDVMDTITSGELDGFEDLYKDAPGVFMFRGAPSRNPSFSGELHGDSVSFSVDWVFTTKMDTTHTEHGVWFGGTGWTGQPIYIHWPDSLVRRFKTDSIALTEHFSSKEIIIASLCGNLYFIDFETGKPSRECYDAENVLKGTPSLNPTLNGQLYVGHGVQKTTPFGNFTFDLFTHKTMSVSGRDKNAWKRWGAYDSSPVAVGGFLFRPGENGTTYKYYIADNQYHLHSTLRYSLTKAKRSPGIESSMAVCRNYGYIADNAGNIICLNLNNLKPVWHYANHDDTDATPVVDEEDGVPFVYTGCEVDRRGSSGISYFVKLNGLTGELVWEDTVSCHKVSVGGKILDGGMYSSPLLGERDCKDLIFTNFSVNQGGVAGYFTAIDKSDGRIVYQTKTKRYCWSSPVAFYRGEEMFVFVADTGGNVYLIKGKTGEIVASTKIGRNFESSPVVVEDKVVIGSRGNKIYKISLE